MPKRVQARACLDATNTGREARLGKHFEKPNVAGSARMRATAKLERGADGEHANHFAVLLFKNADRATRFGLVHGQGVGRDLGVLEDAGIDEIFDLLDFACFEGAGAAVVESESVRAHQRALLRRSLANDFAQGPMQKMGCAVIASGRAPKRVIDPEIDLRPDLERTRDNLAAMNDQAFDGFLRVVDLKARAVERDGAPSPTWPPCSA